MNRVAFREIKIHVWDLVRVVGFVAPFAQRLVSVRGKFVLLSPRGLMGTRGCPQQRYTTGEPGKVHGRDRVGILEGPVGTGPAGSVFEENLFYRETRGTRRRSRHTAKISSDLPGSLP